MRMALALVPFEAGKNLIELPEGTHKVHIEAYWSVAETDSAFRGGITEIDFELRSSDDRAHEPGA
jgi:hypothetical protein